MPEVSSTFLTALQERDRTRLLQRSVGRHLGRGESLYFTGEPSERVHLLHRGVIKLSARNGEGDETILGLAVPGDIVGDIAALDGLPQPYDAVAATAAYVIALDGELLADLVRADPRVALSLGRMVARRARWMADTALERTASEVPARLAGRLLDLAELMGAGDRGPLEVELPLGQADLARLAGMCRESACKTLRSFKAAGFVDYKGRRVRILRPEALRRIRCAGRVAKPFR
jgi:CRP/FNR family transcriptional regulator, cyclic AMP receptor protein